MAQFCPNIYCCDNLKRRNDIDNCNKINIMNEDKFCKQCGTELIKQQNIANLEDYLNNNGFKEIDEQDYKRPNVYLNNRDVLKTFNTPFKYNRNILMNKIAIEHDIKCVIPMTDLGLMKNNKNELVLVILTKRAKYGSLDQYLHDLKSCSESQLVDIIIRILDSVKELHDCDLSHADLHTGNFVLDENNRLYIIDFDSLQQSSFGQSMDIGKLSLDLLRVDFVQKSIRLRDIINELYHEKDINDALNKLIEYKENIPNIMHTKELVNESQKESYASPKKEFVNKSQKESYKPQKNNSNVSKYNNHKNILAIAGGIGLIGAISSLVYLNSRRKNKRSKRKNKISIRKNKRSKRKK